nr:twin-arginine translocation signal domain-containing protein [Pyrinomonadaceae bacterium]
MTEQDKNSRREFIKQAGASAAAVAAGNVLLPQIAAAQEGQTKGAMATGRVLGANDRINVGFVGCGGRM